MNILTFDIEEWYIEQAYHGGRAERYREFDSYLDRLLELLQQEGKRATFFCLGKMAALFPDVIKRIQAGGHEIGCHSDRHLWITKMTPEEFLSDTRTAMDSLQQCTGEKVVSFRAPAFSIGRRNVWAFDVLAECGVERDASVFPASRDFGGFSEYGSERPGVVVASGREIKEFPIAMAQLMGRRMAYSGGGYFRFFPLWFVKREMGRADYSMTYFHIGDLLPEQRKVMSREAYEEYFKEPGTLVNRYKRYIKSSLGKSGAAGKLMDLISNTDVMSLEQADGKIDWGSTQKIDIERFRGGQVEAKDSLLNSVKD